MKPQLTLELKARFFAQYVRVAKFEFGYIDSPQSLNVASPLGLKRLHKAFDDPSADRQCLFLRKLCDMTDLEAIEIAKCIGENAFESRHKQGWIVERSFGEGISNEGFIDIKKKHHRNSVVIDATDGEVTLYEYIPEKLTTDYGDLPNSLWAYQHMISLGFALPYRGHSVEELVIAGWIKLIE